MYENKKAITIIDIYGLVMSQHLYQCLEDQTLSLMCSGESDDSSNHSSAIIGKPKSVT